MIAHTREPYLDAERHAGVRATLAEITAGHGPEPALAVLWGSLTRQARIAGITEHPGGETA